MRSASAILAKEANGRPALRQRLGMSAWTFLGEGYAKKIGWCAFRRIGQREGRHVKCALARA